MMRPSTLIAALVLVLAALLVANTVSAQLRTEREIARLVWENQHLRATL